MTLLHGILFLLLLLGLSAAAFLIAVLLLCVLPDWWPHRPMTRRRALKIAHREIDERCEAALYDMQVAARGGKSTRSGVWW